MKHGDSTSNGDRRVTVRLRKPLAEKLDKIARKITPKGATPQDAVAIRHLIDKEPL